MELFTALIECNSEHFKRFEIDCMLNRLLQTCPELAKLRTAMSAEDFEKIYACWSISNCVSGMVCLSIWNNRYKLAMQALQRYEEQIELDGLQVKELERIVDYLEGPCFVKFRIQLMENSNEQLSRCLYRLAAILPQHSKHFAALKNRLLLGVQFAKL